MVEKRLKTLSGFETVKQILNRHARVVKHRGTAKFLRIAFNQVRWIHGQRSCEDFSHGAKKSGNDVAAIKRIRFAKNGDL